MVYNTFMAKSTFWSWFKATNKFSLVAFLIIYILSFAAFINSLILGDWFKISLAFVALILYFVPLILKKFLNILLPTMLEIVYYLFIFASLILGEVFAFYGPYPHWDIVLHFLSGFILAGVGVSIINIAAKGKTPRWLILVFAFCFSMTLGAAWECVEFSFDQLTRTDAQKDAHLSSISTITMQRDGGNRPVRIDGITSTDLHLENGETITIDEGFLDIGIMDTMKDLFVNATGAATFVILALLDKKQNLTKNFILKNLK